MNQIYYALSLTQPWATLAVLGLKGWETRSWHTKIRGTVFTHAASTFPEWARQFVHQREFKDALAPYGYVHSGSFPLGRIIGKVDIIGCEPTETVRQKISAREKAFGNYLNNRFGFQMEKPIRFQGIYPCKAFQKFWRFSERYPELFERIKQQEHLVEVSDDGSGSIAVIKYGRKLILTYERPKINHV